MREVIWQPCFEGYEASSDGRIRSVDRVILCEDGIQVRRYRSRELSAWLTRGYKSVHLVHGKADRRRTYIHTLVAEAFHGPRPSPAHQVRHINGDKTDNRAENLTWGTASENNQDIVRHGRNFHANKTTCPRGHPYDIVSGKKKRNRRCSKCDKKNMKQWHIRRRATAAKGGSL